MDYKMQLLVQEKLDKAIIARGLTQKKICEDLKISPSSLSEWKSEKYHIDITKLGDLAKILGVDANYFFDTSDYYLAHVYNRDTTLISKTKDEDKLFPDLKKKEIDELETEHIIVPIEHCIEDVFIITYRGEKHLVARIPNIDDVRFSEHKFFILKDDEIHEYEFIDKYIGKDGKRIIYKFLREDKLAHEYYKGVDILENQLYDKVVIDLGKPMNVPKKK